MEAFVKDENGYLYYVPEGYSGEIDAIVYYPGAQPANDIIAFEQLAEENPDKAIIIDMYSGPKGTTDRLVGGTVDAVRGVENSHENITIGTVDIATHSMGFPFGIPAANAFTDAGYQVGSVVNLDGRYQWNEFNNLSNDTVEKFASSGIPVYNFGQTTQESVCKSNCKKLLNYGVDVTWVGCETNRPYDWEENHATINQAPVQNGLFSVLDGKAKAMTLNPTALFTENTSKMAPSQIEGYDFQSYNYETGEWTHIDETASMSKLASRAGMYSANRAGLWNINNEMSAMGTLVSDFRNNLSTYNVGTLPDRDNVALHKDELLAFKSSSSLNLLLNDSSEATNLSGLIESFKNNNVLLGDTWQLAYSKLDTYDNALKMRAEAATELGNAITDAISELEGCMTEYDNMDTSQLPEIRVELQTAKDNLATLESQKYKEVTTYDADSETYVTTTVIDEGVVAQIAVVEENIRETEKFIAALENLQATYDRVIARLNEAMEKLNAFSGSVASITPSPAYTYVA